MDPRLDPDVRALLETLEAEGGPELETLAVDEARQLAIDGLARFGGVAKPVASVEDVEIPGPLGSIQIRIYTPDAVAARPALVYFHGGGWVLCDLDTHEAVCREISRRSGAVVVAVNYRRAPEHKFPSAVLDSYAATVWVANNTARLGVDPDRIAVGGDSAGGNLAAVISLKARDEDGPRIAHQILVYPVTDLASFDTASYAEFADGFYLTRSEMVWFRDHYLASPENGQHPHASPLRAANLERLPPALILTAECDVLRDEGEAYADRLRKAGVEVVCTRYRGMIHPFFSLSGAIRRAFDAYDEIAGVLRR